MRKQEENIHRKSMKTKLINTMVKRGEHIVQDRKRPSIILEPYGL
jgi:hypothetical protein